ncbi:hypothetical protein [Streptomyces smyrnaeus]|uniref:hypothetical protein n=1 Tax=Streptomyces smyrnaeus TaxID=1387713 RepID=UPI0033CEE994
MAGSPRTDPAAIDLALAETMRRDPALRLVLGLAREEVDLTSGRAPAGVTVACRAAVVRCCRTRLAP